MQKPPSFNNFFQWLSKFTSSISAFISFSTHSLKVLIFVVINLALVKAAMATSYENLAKLQGIIQDKDGYIWFAGQHGLSRYDGYNTVNFFKNSDEWSIPFTWIHDVGMSGDDLVISTESAGIWLFSTHNGETKQLPLEADRKAIYKSIYFNNKYYSYTTKKTYEFDPSNEDTRVIQEGIHVLGFEKTKRYLYVSSPSGLYRLLDGEFKQILTTNIISLTATETGIVAITEDSIHYIDDDLQTKSIDISHNVHVSVKTHNENSFFTLNNLGEITKYHGKTLTILPHNYPKIKATHANYLLHDSSGVLWISSSLGVQKIAPIYITNHEREFKVRINAIDIVSYQGSLVLGSYGQGIFDFDNNRKKIAEHINSLFSQKGKKVMDMLVVGNSIFIATFDGLWEYKPDIQTLEKVNFEGNSNLILKLVEHDKRLYIATNFQGVLVYDLASKSIVSRIDLDEGLSSTEIIDVLPISPKEIWLAGSEGVDVYNSRTHSASQLNISDSGKVVSLVAYDNKIFASTKGNGILVFNQQGDLLSHFAFAINFTQMTIINDEIWAPAQHGLYKINPNTYQLSMIPNTEDYSFSDAPLLQGTTVYIPHYSGVLEVPLVKEADYHAKVLISKTTVSGQSSLNNQAINLDTDNDVISLELSSLDFRPGQSKKFKYQINNSKWQEIIGNQLTLTGLASGDYRIAIKGTNSLGQWSNYQAFADISVAYPWYWHPNLRITYLVIFLIVIFAAVWLFYLRNKSIGNIHRILQQDLTTRGNVALNVTRKLNQAAELSAKLESHSAVDENTAEQAKQVNQLIGECIEQLEQQNNNNEPDSLYSKSLSAALPYLSDFMHKKYDVNIQVSLSPFESSISQELESDLYRIIYEALTTAILNGQGKVFTVNLREFKGKLWLTINDDWESFANFNNKVSFNISMYYIRQIAQKHNAAIKTYNEPESGSQLAISIPLMNIHP